MNALNNIKKFATSKALDQIAFLTVVFSVITFAGLFAKVAVYHPIEGAVTLIVFAMFARWAVVFMWGKITEQPV